MPKKIKEAGASKVYALKDKNRKRVRLVEPPRSIKSKFDKKHSKGTRCFSQNKLINIIKEMSRLKLLKSKTFTCKAGVFLFVEKGDSNAG